jgi:hypothetical protein
MSGCFRNVFAGIGCFVVAVVMAVVAWHYRADIADVYRSLADRSGEASEMPDFAIGYPSAEGLRAAERKESSIAGQGGAERIVLTADEMASLIQDRLDSRAKMALDSIRVRVESDRFSLEAELLTDVFGSDLLGPLRGIMDPREPVRVSGQAEVIAPGIVGWRIDEFVIASFPFPAPIIPTLVDRLTGGSDGVILISVPATVGDLRIRADGVTFYRRAD